MADIKRCWVRTTHEAHGWTEVDGEVKSLVDASTVLQVPPGSNVGYHHCIGVPDLVEASKNYKRRETDPYGHDRLCEVSRGQMQVDVISRVEPSEFILERRVTLDAVYDRAVIEGPWVKVQQITCFCCSCDPDGSTNDPACRNHGFAATRPCEEHGCPGSVWDDFELDGEGKPDSWAGTMPESVQQVRRIQAELRATDYGG